MNAVWRSHERKSFLMIKGIKRENGPSGGEGGASNRSLAHQPHTNPVSGEMTPPLDVVGVTDF